MSSRPSTEPVRRGGAGLDGLGSHAVAVLGSTGSIGRQTLDVLGRLTDRFRVVALAAHQNGGLLAEQARQFRPELVALTGDEPTGAVDLPAGVAFERGGG